VLYTTDSPNIVSDLNLEEVEWEEIGGFGFSG
jgi:hypothetical protein